MAALKKLYSWGLFDHALVYWGTTNLKDEYAPNKIVIKVFTSLGQFCCSQET